MILIVGLGNPEERYRNSRHNVGFMVVDTLAKRITHHPEIRFTLGKKFKALLFRAKVADKDLVLVKPQTYVNNSGWTVHLMADFYHVTPNDIWVVHDDIDLPLGKLRIRLGGASGGHNGIRSIIGKLGSDKFVRFRLGIGRGKLDDRKSTAHNLHRRMVTEFVLSTFSKSEKGKARQMIVKCEKAVLTALEQGINQAR